MVNLCNTPLLTIKTCYYTNKIPISGSDWLNDNEITA